jgi:photosystem II stability/assembly factor-like uncharacterized protein
MTKAPLDSLTWRCIGPHRGGRSVAVAGDPTDFATFYMGTTGGGVWKTIDGGQYWFNVSDGFFKRASVGGLAVAHSDSNVIYAAMGETTIRGNVSHGDGVYKSTDGGNSWRHLGLAATRNIAKVRVHPGNPDIAYVAAFGHAHGPNAERGVYRTRDGGETWDLVLHRNEQAGAGDLALDPSNPRIIYASIWEARRGPYFLTSGGEGTGLFRSRDGGDTWDELTDKPGMPKGLKGKIGVVSSPVQSGRVWAIVENEDGGVFRSDDGGETWERLNEDRRLRQRAWYYSHIYADPKDASTVLVLNVEVFRSVDGGKTFEVVPAPHGDNHDLWIDPANPRRMILGNDGGGTISYNGGLSWSAQYNQPTAEFYHVATDSRRPYRVYGSQQDNTSICVPSRSNHGVITRTEWYEVGGGEAGYIAVRSDNPDIVFGGEYQGYMTRFDLATRQARSISVWPEEYSGSGAESYKYRFQWTYPIILSPHDPNVLFCGGNHVFKSTNEGSSWESISLDLTRNDPSTLGPSGGPITKDNTGAEVYGTVFTIAESPVERGLIWAGSDDGLVHVTRDGGKHWTNVTPPELPEWSLISLIEASPFEPETAYLAANRYKHDDFKPYLFKTSDGGKTWTTITDGIADDDFTRVVREDPGQRGLLYAGTETGIYVSYNDGASWMRLGGNLPVVPIHDFVFTEDDLVVATHGRSFWILDDVSLIRQLANQDAAQKTMLFRPRDTFRYGSMFGFGHSPVPGKNYTFAGTQVPAYMYEKTPDGEVKTKLLDAGENPPEGVIINYFLAAEPDAEISLTILDGAGNEIRTLKSKPKEAEKPKDDAKPFPPEEKKVEDEDEPKLPAKAGLNRFVWDFRLPNATKIATKGGDQPSRSGPKVVPGDYRVRLTVGDTTQTESFTIKPDPRLSTTPAQYKDQFDLLKAIHDQHNDLNVSVNTIRSIRNQAIDWVKRVKSTPAEATVTESAKSLAAKLDEIEENLLQVKIQSEQDSLNYPVKLNGKLVALASVVGNSETAPTKQARELSGDLAKQVDADIERLHALLSTDLPAFNEAIAKAGIAAVVLDQPK